MNKQELRTKYLKIRNDISNKDIKSDIIFNKIINTSEYQSANTVALYKNLISEVDTNKLIDYTLTIGKTVSLPRVEDNNLNFYKVDKQTLLIKSNFGVFEPISNQVIPKENIDLIIVPGVCFDKNNNRLGFGKGYYDRYLMNTKMKKIGICFIEQLTNNIPADSNDVKMDLIICPVSRLRFCLLTKTIQLIQN